MTEKSPAIWAIGLMSGTSLDGVDAALIKTDGVEVFEIANFISVPFSEELYQDLHEAVHGRGDIPRVERDLTKMHADVVKQLLDDAGRKPKEIGVIGFHGQTISHRPKEGITWQIGNGALLAGLTKIDVVCDFRRRDVAAGGEGAPLVPLYHAALARKQQLPLAVLNIGGISNVTWVGNSEEQGDMSSLDIFAFDTGPGNAMLNDWIRKRTGEPYDKDGKYAFAGRVFDNVVEDFVSHPYFTRIPPKSLDRNDFNISAMQNLSLEDGAATLTRFAAEAVAKSRPFFPVPPKRWLVTGGGRHNPAIMKALSELLGDVKPVEVVGWNGDAMEAEAFAFLAVRSLKGLPLSLPTTTGAAYAVTGGALYRSGQYGVN